MAELENETRIYVGLNDSETRKQKYTVSTYAAVLKQVCYHYHVPFSFTMEQGGYFHEDGEFVQENTLVLTLIGIDEKTTVKIAEDLCTLFHQESVLVTFDHVKIISVQQQVE